MIDAIGNLLYTLLNFLSLLPRKRGHIDELIETAERERKARREKLRSGPKNR